MQLPTRVDSRPRLELRQRMAGLEESLLPRKAPRSRSAGLGLVALVIVAWVAQSEVAQSAEGGDRNRTQHNPEQCARCLQP